MTVRLGGGSGAPGSDASAADAARPARRELAAELADVVRDLPLFATAPLYRRWHRHWGATAAEITATLPGDALFRGAQFRVTRAITIDAPPEAVWPWLVQAGLPSRRVLQQRPA